MPYAKNNQDPTSDSPMLETNVGLTLLYHDLARHLVSSLVKEGLVMGDQSSRNRYRPGDSRSKIHILSPIREMSSIPVNVIPKGTKVMKGPGGHAPILVQALPPTVKHPKPKMKPSERHYNNVDQVVADYLHYARYGQVMPVLHGDSTGMGGAGIGGGVGPGGGLSCACCVDRNRENTMKKLALQRGEDLTAIDAALAAPKDTPTDQSAGSPVTRGPAQHTIPPANRHYMSEPNHAPMSWGHYQPAPNAGTFLNPEFNRPFVLQSAYEDADYFSKGYSRDTHHDRINEQVLEASSKFDLSMQKLQSQVDKGFVPPQGVVFVDDDQTR
ncbi:hypothetical protein PoB_003731200 [Plakobranchus ocellatus]|uniref:Uncharacterized protein n=1 Tax=Plakobranchus ocellatus TaxID=259542 RepID=A0AAV4AU09_9GAST|nr:hypothetical protein PoB_003731200 [Plakobranchus ocellatus]